jgi:hypothetical protein
MTLCSYECNIPSNAFRNWFYKSPWHIIPSSWIQFLSIQRRCRDMFQCDPTVYFLGLKWSLSHGISPLCAGLYQSPCSEGITIVAEGVCYGQTVWSRNADSALLHVSAHPISGICSNDLYKWELSYHWSSIQLFTSHATSLQMVYCLAHYSTSNIEQTCPSETSFAFKKYTTLYPRGSWLQIRRPGFDSRHYQKKKK